MGATREVCKILNLSDLKGLLKGGQRDIVDRVALTEILKTMILSLYNPNMLSETYVRDVGHAWDTNKLPGLPPSPDLLISAVNAGSLEQIELAMGVSGQSNAVNTYLEKLRSETVGTENEGKLEGLQKEFLKAITVKMLAKHALAKHPAGLADSRLEILLGQAIFKNGGSAQRVKPVITKEQFEEKYNAGQTSAEEVYFSFTVEMFQLWADGTPEAVSAVMELIPLLAEPRIVVKNEKKEAILDPSSVSALLKAG
jgi:hypothetical protein